MGAGAPLPEERTTPVGHRLSVTVWVPPILPTATGSQRLVNGTEIAEALVDLLATAGVCADVIWHDILSAARSGTEPSWPPAGTGNA